MTYPRFQLSLLVPSAEAALIESVRQAHNPLQKALIPAHTTLCREDEIRPLHQVLDNLARLTPAPITIRYGQLSRFDEGKGLWLPSEGDNEVFAALRKEVLQGVIAQPRPHCPHLTLIHPRNGTCTDAIFAAVQRYPWPTTVRFTTISLIEQAREGAVWQVLQTFSLADGQ